MNKHPILSNGEMYVEPLTKRFFSQPKSLPHEYTDAKERLSADIGRIQEAIETSEEVFLDTKIICVRLEPKFEAKSYIPNSLVAGSCIKMVGGRKYQSDAPVDSAGKLYFLRATDTDIEGLRRTIGSTQKDGNQSWREQLCTIRSIDLLHPEEKVMGFNSDWASGEVEVVLHPLGAETDAVINGFFSTTGLSADDAAIRTYEDGLTFISVHMDQDTIQKAQGYNPLRSIKPIREILMDDPFRRVSMTGPAPQLPDQILGSEIKIGVFDGGVSSEAELLLPYVSSCDCVDADANPAGLEHGSMVASAVLFGNLANVQQVDNPLVNVEAFRVSPFAKTGDPYQDHEMYATIDMIEKVVKERPDIKVFNLSFGPSSPIIDDEINRFTYVCDKLTYDVEDGEVNPLFCVAAGNDGDRQEPLNRIQSPSDMVNGMCIGAYSYTPLHEKARASYSCIGPGREGAKIKPDILEFGGDVATPFIGAINRKGLVGANIGTSFSAPIVAGKIGKIMAMSNNIAPHLARSLLIHHAQENLIEGTNENGFGFCAENVEEVLNCTDNNVTILYSGELQAGNSVRLPFFCPGINGMKGNVLLRWTICTVVNPNQNDPDAYTDNCIEDTFYPHSMCYYYRKQGGKTEKVNMLSDGAADKVKHLTSMGYRQSDLPVSKPGNVGHREADLRSRDYKWDTVIRKEVSVRSNSLFEPFLSLHAIGRNEGEQEKLHYFVVLSISAPKYAGSLYDSIVNAYRNLTPIQVRNVARITT